MIDMLQQFRNEIDISEYCYLGMGSIYYYDYILIHKMLGIDDLVSIDNKTTVKRFKFNKPYEFIKFHNCLTTDFLRGYDWEKKHTIVWLDYDSHFERSNDYIVNDLKILGNNCSKNDIVFITVNARPPKDEKRGETKKGEDFLSEYNRYISQHFKKVRYTKPKLFPELMQNIFLNILKEGCEYNDNKFHKLCSFTYRDGAPMFTLGGIFTGDFGTPKRLEKLHKSISLDEKAIFNINIPNITYKEKYYLDSQIDTIGKLIRKASDEVEKLGLSTIEEKKERLKYLLAEEMKIELLPEEVKNYLDYYKYFPQYYEGVI
jgi:hypothetical protein